MERKEILAEPSYWLASVQTSLFRLADKFMREHDMNRKGLASHLGVTPGYVSQLLNGDYDHKLSHVAELSIALGYVPVVNFVPIREMEDMDRKDWVSMRIGADVSTGQQPSDMIFEIIKAA